jgi:hypothetical protein
MHRKEAVRKAGNWLKLVRANCSPSYAPVDYFPIQKLEKIRPSKSSELKAPVISPRACCA